MAPTTINQERRLDYSLQPSQTYYEGSSTGRVSFVLDPHFPTKCFLFKITNVLQLMFLLFRLPFLVLIIYL